jgi:hypothetical protein
MMPFRCSLTQYFNVALLYTVLLLFCSVCTGGILWTWCSYAAEITCNEPDLKVCDGGTLVQILCVLTLSILPFLFKTRMMNNVQKQNIFISNMEWIMSRNIKFMQQVRCWVISELFGLRKILRLYLLFFLFLQVNPLFILTNGGVNREYIDKKFCSSFRSLFIRRLGRVIAEVVSLRFPTVVARVLAQVGSHGICGGQSGTGAGRVRVLWFPLPIFMPPNVPHSSSIIRDWCNRPNSCRRSKWTVSPHPKKLKIKPIAKLRALFLMWILHRFWVKQ